MIREVAANLAHERALFRRSQVMQGQADPDDVRGVRLAADAVEKIAVFKRRRTGQPADRPPGEFKRRDREIDPAVGDRRVPRSASTLAPASPAGDVDEAERPREFADEKIVQAFDRLRGGRESCCRPSCGRAPSPAERPRASRRRPSDQRFGQRMFPAPRPPARKRSASPSGLLQAGSDPRSMRVFTHETGGGASCGGGPGRASRTRKRVKATERRLRFPRAPRRAGDAEGQHRERGGEFEAPRDQRGARILAAGEAHRRPTWRTPPAQASAPVVTAVPSAMAKVAATPAANSPCASANTSTRIAPEQGRAPAAITVPAALRQEKRAVERRGIGRMQQCPHRQRGRRRRRGRRGRPPPTGSSPALAPGDARRRPAPRPAPGARSKLRLSAAISAPPFRQTRHRPMAATPAALASASQSAASVHLRGGGVEDEPRRADQRDGDHRLQERREERHHRAAPERAIVGQHVGGDQRLAVARARRRERRHRRGRGRSGPRRARDRRAAHGPSPP